MIQQQCIPSCRRSVIRPDSPSHQLQMMMETYQDTVGQMVTLYLNYTIHQRRHTSPSHPGYSNHPYNSNQRKGAGGYHTPFAPIIIFSLVYPPPTLHVPRYPNSPSQIYLISPRSICREYKHNIHLPPCQALSKNTLKHISLQSISHCQDIKYNIRRSLCYALSKISLID